MRSRSVVISELAFKRTKLTCSGEHLMVKCICKREENAVVLVDGMCIQSTF